MSEATEESSVEHAERICTGHYDLGYDAAIADVLEALEIARAHWISQQTGCDSYKIPVYNNRAWAIGECLPKIRNLKPK